MQKLYPIEYDESNKAHYVFFIEVMRGTLTGHGFNGNYQCEPYGFPTLGHAMVFLQPHIAGELKQDKPGDLWWADLKPDSSLNGESVRIRQLVMT